MHSMWFSGWMWLRKERMSYRGKFIVIEGPDGAGKTTQAEILVNNLRADGSDVKYYREPGSTMAGELMREIIKDPKIPLSAQAQILAIMSSRSQLVWEIIDPAIRSGMNIVLDRYTPSTIAYRPETDKGFILELDGMMDYPIPDLYIFLDAKDESLIQRSNDKMGKDRYDFQSEMIVTERINIYRDLHTLFHGCVINTDQGIADTAEEIYKMVLQKFPKLGTLSM